MMRYMKGPAFKTHAALYQSELFNFDTRTLLVVERAGFVLGAVGTRDEGLEFLKVKITILEDPGKRRADGSPPVPLPPWYLTESRALRFKTLYDVAKELQNRGDGTFEKEDASTSKDIPIGEAGVDVQGIYFC